MNQNNSLEQFIESLETFNASAELAIIVESNADVITALQKEQMSEGKSSNGQDTQLLDNYYYDFGYRPYTIEKKKKSSGLGAVTDHVTGFMTGKLYDSLKTTFDGDEFWQSSSVPYFEELLSRTGEEWMGLDDEKRAIFVDRVTLPEFSNILEEKTSLQL